MDFNIQNKTKEVKKKRYSWGLLVALILVILLGIFIKYENIILNILNPKNIGQSISKNVNTENIYPIKGSLYFVKNNNLWYIKGIKAHKVTNTNNVSDIAISKNGVKVSYVTFHTNYSNLHEMNINGTNNRRITQWSNPNIANNAWSATPTFSPDGQYIAYLSNIEDLLTGVPIASLGVWMIPSNAVFPTYGSQLYNETLLIKANPYTGGDAGLNWPNNNFLLYTSYIYYTNTPQPNSQIMLYDFNTQQSYPVTPVSSDAMQPRLSPNENYLAFTKRVGNNSNYLYLMKFNLNNILTHTENSNFNTYNNKILVQNGITSEPVWSPSGNSIAFSYFNNNSFDIFLKNIIIKKNKLSTGKLIQITSNSSIDSTSKMYWLSN